MYSITKDKLNRYTNVSPSFTSLFSIEPYHRDKEWRVIPEELGLCDPVRDQLAAIEHKVIKDKQAINTVAVWKPNNVALQVITQRTPVDSGGFTTDEYITPVESLYQGWPKLLDYELEVLKLPNGKHLTRRDLSVLHYSCLGLPRKLTAHANDCSVRSIEKRLAKIKRILTPDNQVRHSLPQCLLEQGLIPFLMAEVDWFSLKERIQLTKA